MKQPLWKKILSYFHEFHIENTSSPFNPTLDVCLRSGRYLLKTPNVIYSFGDLYDNFFKAFEQINLGKNEPKSVLLLGFGLGSIPYMLEKKFHKKYAYTAVEIDEVVIHLAKKYVTDELRSPIEFVCADAAQYVSQSGRKFDMICMDVFLDHLVPSQMEQTLFLEGLAKRLQPQTGILLYNRLTATDVEKRYTQHFFQKIFQQTFPEATFLDVDGNWILTNRPLRA